MKTKKHTDLTLYKEPKLECTMDQEEAINSFDPKERAVFDKIKNAYDKKIANDLKWHWYIGQALCRVVSGADDKKAVRKDLIHRITVALGLSDKRGSDVLMADCRLVDAFKTKDNFQKYISLAGPSGNKLTWSHINLLSLVTEEAVREQLAVKVVMEKISVEQLQKRIMAVRKNSDTAKVRSGRPLSVPSNIKSGLEHLITNINRVNRLNEEVWFGNKYHICNELDKIPNNKVVPEILDDVEDAMLKLKTLRHWTSETLIQLEASKKRLEKVLK